MFGLLLLKFPLTFVESGLERRAVLVEPLKRVEMRIENFYNLKNLKARELVHLVSSSDLIRF